jgi:integrase
MAKRRGKNEGTIYQRKDGLWTAQITTGTNPATGKPQRKTFYGKTRADVAQKMNEGLNKVQKGILETANKETLNEWFEEWIEGRKHAIEESTYDNYKRFYKNHIQPAIGAVKLKNLQTRDIQKLVNSIHEEKKIAVSSLQNVFSVLDTCLENAMNRGLIAKNPYNLVELPKGGRKEMHVLKKECLPIFLKAIKSSRFYVAFRLELSTGLRRGELLGLRWQDIDFKTGIITVKQQLTPNGKIKGLKTENSYRSINLFGDIIKLLETHKAKQNEKRLLLGEAYNKEDDLVFCHDDGSRLSPRSFLSHYKILLKNAGLDTSLRFHDLRHSFTTLALEAGIPVKTVQSFLGHSSATTTLEVYTHVTEGMQKNAAETISNLIAVNMQ